MRDVHVLDQSQGDCEEMFEPVFVGEMSMLQLMVGTHCAGWPIWQMRPNWQHLGQTHLTDHCHHSLRSPLRMVSLHTFCETLNSDGHSSVQRLPLQIMLRKSTINYGYGVWSYQSVAFGTMWIIKGSNNPICVILNFAGLPVRDDLLVPRHSSWFRRLLKTIDLLK